jgi:hypothetical protein
MWLTIHPNERMHYTSQPQSMVQSQRDQDKARTSTLPNQTQESMIIQGKDVMKGVRPKFVYQSSYYYELVDHWEVDENTNVDMFEEFEKNYP